MTTAKADGLDLVQLKYFGASTQPPNAVRTARVIIHAKNPDIVAIMRSFLREAVSRSVKTRRWTETESADLRSMGEAGKDARSIGKELHRSFMGVQAKAKKLKITLRRVEHDHA